MTKNRTEVADIDRSLYDFTYGEEGFERLDAGITPDIVREISAKKDDAHLGRGVLHVVVYEFGVVLRADACQVAALGLGDTQALKGVLDVVGHRLPVVLLVGVGLDVGDDVVHVQALDGGAPRRVGKTVEDLEGL